MVARRDTRPALAGFTSGVFAWWRRLLGTTFREGATAAQAAAQTAVKASSRLEEGPEPLLAPTLPIWAIAAVVVGGGLGVTLAPAEDKRAAAASAALALLWAVARYVLLRFAAADELEPNAVRGAWAIGTLPWAVAVDPVTTALAFVISATITWQALERLGASRRRAVRAVALAFGAQLVITLIAWVGRSAYVLYLVGR